MLKSQEHARKPIYVSSTISDEWYKYPHKKWMVFLQLAIRRLSKCYQECICTFSVFADFKREHE